MYMMVFKAYFILLNVTQTKGSLEEDYKDKKVYIWNEGRKMFLTYPENPRDRDPVILTPGGNGGLSAWIIDEVDKDGTLMFYTTDANGNKNPKKVMDVSWNTKNLTVHSPNWDPNQKFYLKGVNVNLYRLENINECIEADEKDAKILKGRNNPCKVSGIQYNNQLYRLFGDENTALDYENLALNSRYPLPDNLYDLYSYGGYGNADSQYDEPRRKRRRRNGLDDPKDRYYDFDSYENDRSNKRGADEDICCHEKRYDSRNDYSDDRYNGWGRENQRQKYKDRSYINPSNSDAESTEINFRPTKELTRENRMHNPFTRPTKNNSEQQPISRALYQSTEENEIANRNSRNKNMDFDDCSLESESEPKSVETDTYTKENAKKEKVPKQLSLKYPQLDSKKSKQNMAETERNAEETMKKPKECLETLTKDSIDPICHDEEIKNKLKEISALSPIPLNWG